MSNKILIPIKSILTGGLKISQIEEFEFVRNNPVASTIGATLIGGAVVHDYHKNGYNSVGGYIGDKIDSTKKIISSGLDKTREVINHATENNIPELPETHHIDSSSLT